jgi:hypothetical protein
METGQVLVQKDGDAVAGACLIHLRPVKSET